MKNVEKRVPRKRKLQKWEKNNVGRFLAISDEVQIATTSADEDRSAGLKLLIFIYVHLCLSAPAMSTDNSQVGVAICTPF